MLACGTKCEWQNVNRILAGPQNPPRELICAGAKGTKSVDDMDRLVTDNDRKHLGRGRLPMTRKCFHSINEIRIPESSMIAQHHGVQGFESRKRP